MKVYRVEDKYGEGAYMASNGDCLSSTPTPRQPGPITDGMGYRPPPGDIRFGFSSDASLHQWFNPAELSCVAGYGASEVAYLVPRASVVVGGHQVAFDASHAKLAKIQPHVKRGEVSRTV